MCSTVCHRLHRLLRLVIHKAPHSVQCSDASNQNSNSQSCFCYIPEVERLILHFVILHNTRSTLEIGTGAGGPGQEIPDCGHFQAMCVLVDALNVRHCVDAQHSSGSRKYPDLHKGEGVPGFGPF